MRHPDSQVTANGTYRTAAGVRRRYRCEPAIGEPLTFSVTQAQAHASRAVPVWTPPPACPDHSGSHVVRNGTYGLATPWRRPRYRCQPLGGAKRHSFTPPLPRDHVHLGEEHCDSCDEIVEIHRGETAAARRYSWSKRIVPRGLEMMSRGTV